eukprot:Rhum_TRINITY_DN15158_c11_g1::Rhum_TRINITY_DN15158_c11_g1_i1::g.141310::m.141310
MRNLVRRTRLDLAHNEPVGPRNQQHAVRLPHKAAAVHAGVRCVALPLHLHDLLVLLHVENLDALVVRPRNKVPAPLDRVDGARVVVQVLRLPDVLLPHRPGLLDQDKLPLQSSRDEPRRLRVVGVNGDRTDRPVELGFVRVLRAGVVEDGPHEDAAVRGARRNVVALGVDAYVRHTRLVPVVPPVLHQVAHEVHHVDPPQLRADDEEAAPHRHAAHSVAGHMQEVELQPFVLELVLHLLLRLVRGAAGCLRLVGFLHSLLVLLVLLLLLFLFVFVFLVLREHGHPRRSAHHAEESQPQQHNEDDRPRRHGLPRLHHHRHHRHRALLPVRPRQRRRVLRLLCDDPRRPEQPLDVRVRRRQARLEVRRRPRCVPHALCPQPHVQPRRRPPLSQDAHARRRHAHRRTAHRRRHGAAQRRVELLRPHHPPRRPQHDAQHRRIRRTRARQRRAAAAAAEQRRARRCGTRR